MASKNHKLSYKLYQPDGTYLKLLTEVGNILSEFQVNKTINGGVSNLKVIINAPIDDYDEYDSVKNPNGVIKYGNRLKVYLNDDFNTDTLIFYGYLVRVSPQYGNNQEKVELTFYGAISKLSNDYYRTHSDPIDFYVPESAISTSTIIKNISDNYIDNISNSMISYTWGVTIDDCANTVSYTFDRVKHLDSLKKIQEYLPATWYWYIDAGGVVYVKDSASSTQHSFTIGKDISEIKAHKSAESIVNYFFLWNGRSTADASYVYEEYKDATSQSNYEVMTLFQLDSEVLIDSVADIRGNALITNKKDPKQQLTIELTDEYDLASIEPGHRVLIRNIRDGNQTTFQDNLVIKRVSYKIDSALVELDQIGHDLTKYTSMEETAVELSIIQAQRSTEGIQAGDTPITEANIEYSGGNFINENIITAYTGIGDNVIGLNGTDAILRSYGKTGFNNSSIGFWMQKDTFNDVFFELYADSDNYLRYNSNTGKLELAGDITLGPSTTITWSQISDANPPNSADLKNGGWTNSMDDLINGNVSGGTFISSTTVYSPIIAGSSGYFRDSIEIGASGIGGVLKSYNKSGYGNGSSGFWLEYESGGDIRFELYDDATHYIRFDTGGSPALIIRGGVNADDIYTGTLSADRIASTSIEAGKLGTTVISGGKIITGLLTADNIQAGTLSGRTVKSSSGNSRIELINGDYLDFYSGGVRRARLRGTTLGAGGIQCTAGDFFIPNNRSYWIADSTGSATKYGGIGITSGNLLWITCGTTDNFYIKNNAQTVNLLTATTTQTYVPQLIFSTGEYINSNSGSNDMRYYAGDNHEFYQGATIKAIIDENIWTAGDLQASGSKPFVIPHPDGSDRFLRYTAQESPDVCVRCRGKAKTGVDKKITVILPNHFYLVTEPTGLITVNLTPIGPAHIFLEKEPTNEKIFVESSETEVDFFYEVVAVRKGYLNSIVELDETDVNLTEGDKKVITTIKTIKNKNKDSQDHYDKMKDEVDDLFKK